MGKEAEPHDPNAERKRAINSIFLDIYGIPYSFAVTISGWDNPLGEHWRKRIKDFQTLIEKDAEDGKIDVL